MTPLKNKNGSALIVGLSLIPIILTLLFGVSYFFHIIHLQSEIQKICYQDSRQLQKNIIPKIELLLSLNSQARILKALELKTKLELAAALAGLPETIALVAKLKLELSRIQAQRKALDITQKTIINTSNLSMQTNLITTNTQLQRAFSNFKKNRSWMYFYSSIQTQNSSGLAVQPDSSDIAPVYRLKDNFEKEQALAHKWQILINIKEPLSRFIDPSVQWIQSCSTTLGKEHNQWVVKSSQDRL